MDLLLLLPPLLFEQKHFSLLSLFLFSRKAPTPMSSGSKRLAGESNFVLSNFGPMGRLTEP